MLHIITMKLTSSNICAHAYVMQTVHGIKTLITKQVNYVQKNECVAAPVKYSVLLFFFSILISRFSTADECQRSL